MKNILLKTTCIICMAFFPMLAISQSELLNHKKYWDYRDRLKKFFLKIGPLAGESIPMENRTKNINNSDIRFGDATIHLGYYIAVLASEYKLLCDAQEWEQALHTKKELYYAINAVNRLDFFSEPYMYPGSPGALNGFILRDDVRPIFKDNWPWVPNNPHVQPWSKQTQASACSSDWFSPSGYNDNNDMSQDQIVSLLMGFAFVKKFVDNNIVAPSAIDPGLQLVTEVENITHRIFDYITPVNYNVITTMPLLLTVPQFLQLDENWVITNIYSASNLAKRGAEMGGFSYIIAEICHNITGTTTTPAFVFNSNNPFFLQGSPTIYPPFNITLPLSSIGTQWNDLQYQSLPNVEAFSLCFNSPYDFICWPFDLAVNEINMQMILALAAVGNTWNPSNFNSMVQNSNWTLFGLMNSALHNHPPGLSQSSIMGQLDSAPCEGPNEDGPSDWNGTSRYGHYGKPVNYPGHYNGLDYMLLYNLYQLNFKSNGSLPLYKNNACPCNQSLSRSYLSTYAPYFSPPIDLITHKLIGTQELLRKFPEYLSFNESAPEFLNENLIIENPAAQLFLSTELIVCNNSTLEVQNGGVLNIGKYANQVDPATHGVLRIRPGSTLILRTGSQIILNDSSKVIIEQGANLIFELEAFIKLQGQNTLFDVQSTNVNIVRNQAERFYVTKGSQSIGGTIQFAGGSFSLNTGGILENDGCKVIMKAPMSFNYQHDGIFKLEGNTAAVSVLNPNTQITIQNATEQFIATKANSNLGGLIYFEGGNFNLQSDGKINNNGCKIELGNNMNLDYYQNSQIDLIGQEAMLGVLGTLHLHPNADFHFNYDGFVKFGLPEWTYPNVIADQTNTMTFTGSDKTDKVLEIQDVTGLFTDNMGLISISDGRIELGSFSSINAGNPVNFQNSLFTSTNPSIFSDGLVFNGQSQLTLNNIEVEKSDVGIRSRSFFGGYDFVLKNSQIHDCNIGLVTYDKGAQLINVEINNCEELAWKGVGMVFPSLMQNTMMHSSPWGSGISYLSTGIGGLNIIQSEINNNKHTGIIYSGPSILNVYCSEVKNNINDDPDQHLVANILIAQDAILNMSPLLPGHPFGGHNDVSASNTGYSSNNALLVSDFGQNMMLENGMNLLEAAGYYKLAAGFISLTNQTSLSKIVANNNKWYPGNLNSPNAADVDLKCSAPGGGLKQVDILDDSPYNFSICGVTDPPYPGSPNQRPGPLYDCPGCPLVNAPPRFINVPMNVALIQAIQMTRQADTINGNDLLALDMFNDINLTGLHYDSPESAYLSALSYTKTKETFGYALRDSLVTDSADVAFVKLAAYEQLLMQRAIEDDEDYSEFYRIIDLASLYIGINDRNRAVDILNSLSTCIELSESQYTYYNSLRNVLAVENMVLSGVYPIWSFDSLMSAGGGGYNRLFFKDSKANIDTVYFDSLPDLSVPAFQVVSGNNGLFYSVTNQTQNSLDYRISCSDSLGQIVWSYFYDGREHTTDSVKAICIDGLGFIYITGKSWNGSNFEINTVKMDSAGNQYWTAVYNSPDYLQDEPMGIYINPNGKLVISGKSTNDSISRFFRIEYSQCDSFCVPSFRDNIIQSESTSFSVTPNPVSDGLLNIFYHVPSGEESKFIVYDCNGRKLIQTNLNSTQNRYTVSLHGLVSGVYQAVLNTGKKLQSKKLVIMNK